MLRGLADCIDKSKLQITAANMQAVHTIVCRDKDHTQGYCRQTLAAKIVEAVSLFQRLIAGARRHTSARAPSALEVPLDLPTS